MARKNDILSIYTKVEGIKAGLFKGEAPFVPTRSKVKMETENFFVCVQTLHGLGITRDS